MTRVFADSAYWIAVVNPRDSLYREAWAVRNALGDSQIVTSQWVLVELLNYFAERGPEMRNAASRLVESLMESNDVVVVPASEDGFRVAFRHYSDRFDKSWSITDCSSFLIMELYGIDFALTYDHHFEQAGFKALLR